MASARETPLPYRGVASVEGIYTARIQLPGCSEDVVDLDYRVLWLLATSGQMRAGVGVSIASFFCSGQKSGNLAHRHAQVAGSRAVIICGGSGSSAVSSRGLPNLRRVPHADVLAGNAGLAEDCRFSPQAGPCWSTVIESEDVCPAPPQSDMVG